jgi:hypothetical protein
MLLYAGTALFTSKYTFKKVVKKLEIESLSAGNFLNHFNNVLNKGTSETLRNEIVFSEQVKHVSIHVPTHQKPLNDDQFGHYLAGLIDGDGHFSSNQQLIIVFNSKDIFLAYYIKSYLGYGQVNKVKDKNAYIYVLSKKAGILKVLNLINNKLRTELKYNQVKNNILSNQSYNLIHFNINKNQDILNH